MGVGARHIVDATCLLVLAATLVGCEEDVAAPAGVDEPFSLYGILNPRLLTQTLLVTQLQDVLVPIDDSIDVVVTSTNLETGELYEWHDSSTTNESGRIDHVFWSSFRPEFGSHHRIQARRSDGITSAVDVSVPMQVIVATQDHDQRVFTVEILGDAVRLHRLEAVYVVRRYPTLCAFEERAYAISYLDEAVRNEAGWGVDINLDRHYFKIASDFANDIGQDWGLRFPFINGLAITDLQLRLTVANEDWDPPGGGFDADVLVQPGVLTNVSNGFGFVGAGYNQDFTLRPSSASLEDTWFFNYLGQSRSDLCS